MRDITLGETVYFNFTTRQFSDGVPTVLAGSQALSVLEENNATPITAGVSVEVDRASVVGLNQATIVATGGNGYEAGKGYCVYISTGTVGGVSVVGEVVAQFTIAASASATDLANATDGLTALAADIATRMAEASIDTTGGAVDTVTAVTNAIVLPGIPTNWITAAGINAAAMDGKGNWNIGKTGYSISGSITTLDGLNDISAADVNAQVIDVMDVDTHTEIGQEAPNPTNTYGYMIRYSFKNTINEKVATSTSKVLKNAAGTVVDQKQTVVLVTGISYTEEPVVSG